MHLQPLGNDGRSDELVGGDLLVQLVIGALVKQNQVVQLVPEMGWSQGGSEVKRRVKTKEGSTNDDLKIFEIPGLSLGPLLLLGLATSSLLLLGGL